MRKSRVRIASLLVCALVLLVTLVTAQVVTSTIYGTVLDPQNSGIPRARVTALNTGTGASVSTQADAAGEFTISSLQPGRYDIVIEAAGFKILRRSGLEAASGQRLRVAFNLDLGVVTETVEVTAQAPLINAVSAEQRSDLRASQVQDLPMARRDWTRLLNLAAGISAGDNNVRMNGLPGSAFRVTVDGTDAAQDTEQSSYSMSGGFNIIKGISTEAVAEVNIARGIASAEIANSMSGNVNILTKSGTNQFRGSVFWLNETENLNARNQNLATKPALVHNQYGGSLGGPVLKNKLFFFGVFEGYRQRGFRALNETVPTRELKAQIIAGNRIYEKILSIFPDPNQPYAAGATTARWVGAGTEKADDDHVVARGDWHVTDRTIMTTRYTRGRPMRLLPRVVEANSRTWSGTLEQGNVNVIHLRPAWTYETRFGVNYMRVPRVDALYNLYEKDVSFTGVQGPGFSIGGETLEREGYSYSFEENVGHTRGRHSFKMGGIFLRNMVRRQNIEVPVVRYNSVADMINNLPASGQVTMGVRAFSMFNNTLGVFVQDDFKVNRKLVLNLGLRWDYFTVPKEKDKRLFNRAQPFGTGPYVDPDRIWEPVYTNFAPRIGFAYSLGEGAKTVIRGGAGMFKNPRPPFGGPVDVVRNALDEPFRVNFSRADALAAPQVFTFPIDNAKVTAHVKGPQGLIGDTAINTDLPYPTSYQWTLTVQRELVSDFALETGYMGTRGLNLMMVRFWNQPNRLTGIRPYAGFSEFRYRDAGEQSHYHAWQSSLRKRFSRGFAWNLNHTYAYGYSYTNDADLLLPASVQDIYNVRADKGPREPRHRVVSDFVYELPFARWSQPTSLAGRNLLSGWQVSGIFRAQTGEPVNVSQPSGLDSSRPDYVGGQVLFSDYQETLRYVNRAAFAPVPVSPVSGLLIRPGNVGRNAFRDPGLWNIDLSLSKRFYVRERMDLKFDADMLNAFNHTNLSGLELRIDRANFGVLTGTRGARTVQLRLRLSF